MLIHPVAEAPRGARLDRDGGRHALQAVLAFVARLKALVAPEVLRAGLAAVTARHDDAAEIGAPALGSRIRFVILFQHNVERCWNARERPWSPRITTSEVLSAQDKQTQAFAQTHVLRPRIFGAAFNQALTVSQWCGA